MRPIEERQYTVCIENGNGDYAEISGSRRLVFGLVFLLREHHGYQWNREQGVYSDPKMGPIVEESYDPIVEDPDD